MRKSFESNVEKVPEDVEVDEPVALPDPKQEIPLRTKLVAYSMIIFFSTGAFFSESTLGPLKSTLKSNLDITNAQFGAITSATSLINTVLPIIGGIGMDHWGATWAAIIASGSVLIGAVISALGSNINKFALVVCGRIIMGFGSIVLDGAQNKLLAHWFGGTHLGLALASSIAWSRVVTVVAKTTAVPMSHLGGFWGWALWIPAILCGANVGICVAYWAFERTVKPEWRPKLGSAKSKRITLDSITQISRFHWILCITQLFQSAAFITYNSLIADIIRKTRGTSALQAGYTSSVYSVMPIVLTPIVGVLYDRYGFRMWLVPPTGALWLVTFALMGLTKVNPYAPVIIGSLANAFNIVPFVASIPIVVGNDAYLGTAYGIWKCFNTSTTIILEVASGAIQDRSPDQSYDRVIYLLMVIKGLQMFWGPFYDWLDGRWLGHMLRANEKKRYAMGQEIRARGDEPIGWRVHRPTGIIVAASLASCIIVGWVLYIVYSLGQ